MLFFVCAKLAWQSVVIIIIIIIILTTQILYNRLVQNDMTMKIEDMNSLCFYFSPCHHISLAEETTRTSQPLLALGVINHTNDTLFTYQCIFVLFWSSGFRITRFIR